MSDTIQKHECVFRTDSEFRSIPLFHRACELVINGRIGQLKTIRMAVPNWNEPLAQQPEMPVPEELDYNLWLGPASLKPYTEKRVHPPKSYGRPGWYANQEYCNGALVNWGHHLADISQWANGTERTGPVEVRGTGDFPPADGLWNVVLGFDIEYRYANGVRLFSMFYRGNDFQASRLRQSIPDIWASASSSACVPSRPWPWALADW